jgi:hypothetical protein
MTLNNQELTFLDERANIKAKPNLKITDPNWPNLEGVQCILV